MTNGTVVISFPHGFGLLQSNYTLELEVTNPRKNPNTTSAKIPLWSFETRVRNEQGTKIVDANRSVPGFALTQRAPLIQEEPTSPILICFPADATMTAVGGRPVALRDLRPGDRVQTHGDGRTLAEEGVITDFHMDDPQRLSRRVAFLEFVHVEQQRLGLRALRVTPDHLVFAANLATPSPPGSSAPATRCSPEAAVGRSWPPRSSRSAASWPGGHCRR